MLWISIDDISLEDSLYYIRQVNFLWSQCHGQDKESTSGGNFSYLPDITWDQWLEWSKGHEFYSLNWRLVELL